MPFINALGQMGILRQKWAGSYQFIQHLILLKLLHSYLDFSSKTFKNSFSLLTTGSNCPCIHMYFKISHSSRKEGPRGDHKSLTPLPGHFSWKICLTSHTLPLEVSLTSSKSPSPIHSYSIKDFNFYVIALSKKSIWAEMGLPGPKLTSDLSENVTFLSLFFIRVILSLVPAF